MKNITNNSILNDSLYKLDPYKKLTEEQEKLKEHIFKFCYKHLKDEHAIFLINGSASTGKSLLLSSFFNSLRNISRNHSSNALYHKIVIYILRRVTHYANLLIK